MASHNPQRVGQQPAGQSACGHGQVSQWLQTSQGAKHPLHMPTGGRCWGHGTRDEWGICATSATQGPCSCDTESLQLCFSEHHIFAAGLDGQYLLYVLHLVTFGRVVTLHLFCKSTVRSRESCLCLAREGKFLFSLKQPSSIGREPPNSEVRMRQFS